MKNQAKRLENPETEILCKVDVIVFDCDGVLWKGDRVIPGAIHVLNELRKQGKKLLFFTNNSSKSRVGYKQKFDSLGFSVQLKEILSSSFAAALYLDQSNFKDTGKKAYIIGEVGIEEELHLIGVPYVGGLFDAGKTIDLKQKNVKLEHDQDVGAVIVGFGPNINYHKIQMAQLCINENHGCEFIATNMDAVSPLNEQQQWAGSGSMVAAIKGCTGKEPVLVGKPSPFMADYLSVKLGASKERILVVGDNLHTDILFSINSGLIGCLVLSGVTTEKTLLSQANGIQPDFYCESINQLLPCIP